jgi:uncharacterized protein YwgA
LKQFRSRDFILLLLSQTNGRIESETRVQKLAFLSTKEKGIPCFTSFIWEKYGPLSVELWDTAKQMQRNGLLKIRKENRTTFMGDRYTVKIFELTSKGTSEALDVERHFSPEACSIKELHFEYGRLPLDRLLNYVHSAYSPSDL